LVDSGRRRSSRARTKTFEDPQGIRYIHHGLLSWQAIVQKSQSGVSQHVRLETFVTK